MSGLLSHSKNSIPVWFCLFWWAEKLHALSYALLGRPSVGISTETLVCEDMTLCTDDIVDKITTICHCSAQRQKVFKKESDVGMLLTGIQKVVG